MCIEAPQPGQTDALQQTLIGEGKCAVGEICVGSNVWNVGPSQAYCVSTEHFVRIGQNPLGGDGQNLPSSGVVTAGFNSALHSGINGSHVAVEAVVTSIDKKTSLFATSVVMQAQAYNNGIWRAVTGGYSHCARCSSIILAPFPVTAQRVKVDVVMTEESPTGLLWLASYPYW